MKSNRLYLKSLVLPILYLVLFSLCFLFYFPRIREQQTIHLTNDLIYTGLDSYDQNEYLGSYYYQFTDSGLNFYLLNSKKTAGFSAPLTLYGQTISDKETVAEALQPITEKIASTVNFSATDLEELTKSSTLFQQTVLSIQEKCAIGIGMFLALFSMYQILRYFLISFLSKKAKKAKKAK